jgi:hypothetical protein
LKKLIQSFHDIDVSFLHDVRGINASLKPVLTGNALLLPRRPNGTEIRHFLRKTFTWNFGRFFCVFVGLFSFYCEVQMVVRISGGGDRRVGSPRANVQ